MLEVLDGHAARRWAAAALAALGDAREEIDALNVYPVPDGDTGTNLYLTVEAACASRDRRCRPTHRCARRRHLRPRRAARRPRQLRGHHRASCCAAGPTSWPSRRSWTPGRPARHGARRRAGVRGRRGTRPRAPSCRSAGRPRGPRPTARPSGWATWWRRRRGLPRRPRPHPRAARRRCAGPAWSTPAGAGSWCSSRRSPTSSPGAAAPTAPASGPCAAVAARGLRRPRCGGSRLRGHVPARGSRRPGRRTARTAGAPGDSLVVVGGSACGTFTCTSMTLARPSRRGSGPGAPGACGHALRRADRAQRCAPALRCRSGRLRGRARPGPAVRGGRRRRRRDGARPAPLDGRGPRGDPRHGARRPWSCCPTTATRSRPRARPRRPPATRHPGGRAAHPRARCRGWRRRPCTTPPGAIDADVVAMSAAAGVPATAPSRSPPKRR